MKRKIFNRENTPPKTTRATGFWLRIHPKSGGITFSKDLAVHLELNKNFGVNFIQVEDRPKDWYIEKSKDEAAFRVRVKATPKKTEGNFIIQSTVLAREILTSLNAGTATDERLASTRFLVATEPVEKNLYAIITKSAEVSKRKHPPIAA